MDYLHFLRQKNWSKGAVVTSFCEISRARKARTVGAAVKLIDNIPTFYSILLYQLSMWTNIVLYASKSISDLRF